MSEFHSRSGRRRRKRLHLIADMKSEMYCVLWQYFDSRNIKHSSTKSGGVLFRHTTVVIGLGHRGG